MKIDFYGSIAVRLLLGAAALWFFGNRGIARVVPEWRQFQTRTWNIPVDGRVIDSAGGVVPVGRGGQGVGVVDIRFEYELDGQTYRTGRYKLGRGQTDKVNAYEIPATHRPGRSVSGWANPKNPGEAVLIRGGPSIPGAALGGVWLWIGGVCAWYAGQSALGVYRRRAGRPPWSSRRLRRPGDVRRRRG